MNSQYEIKVITTKKTLPLRQKILKPFLTVEQCINDGDDLPTTIHLGLFYKNEIVSTATFILESHPELSAGCPYRLRGMATDSTVQGQGFGQKLLHYGIEYLRAKRCDLIWFNAREKAFGFYKKFGFLEYGDMFELKDIGPHKVMYKPLIPR